MQNRLINNILEYYLNFSYFRDKKGQYAIHFRTKTGKPKAGVGRPCFSSPLFGKPHF